MNHHGIHPKISARFPSQLPLGLHTAAAEDAPPAEFQSLARFFLDGSVGQGTSEPETIDFFNVPIKMGFAWVFYGFSVGFPVK